MSWSLILVPSLGALLLLLICFVQLRYESFCFSLSYMIMFCCYLLEACSFLMRDRKGVDLKGQGGEKELVGVEGGETIVKIHYMRRPR